MSSYLRTHTTSALGEEHARLVFEGAECAHCERFYERPPILEDCGQASAPPRLGPAVAEAQWRLKSWGSQVKLAEELEMSSSNDLLHQDVLSLESSSTIQLG